MVYNLFYQFKKGFAMNKFNENPNSFMSFFHNCHNFLSRIRLGIYTRQIFQEFLSDFIVNCLQKML